MIKIKEKNMIKSLIDKSFDGDIIQQHRILNSPQVRNQKKISIQIWFGFGFGFRSEDYCRNRYHQRSQKAKDLTKKKKKLLSRRS